MRPAGKSVLDTMGARPPSFSTGSRPRAAPALWPSSNSSGQPGSHKDRVALALVEAAERRGDIEPGMTLVDYTGGSTGAALAVVCALKGYRCMVVCSDAYSQEKLRSMAALGADVEVMPSRGGAVDAELVPRLMARAAELGARPGCYYLDMHHREDPVVAGEAIGRELLEQVGAPVDAFCSGFGTGALLMGVARVLRSGAPPARIVALEPASSAVLVPCGGTPPRPPSGQPSGRHRIEGLGYGFVPALLDRALLDDVLVIEEAEARDVARSLARVEGVFAGTSSGFNVAGALRLASRLGPGHVVATACCDTGFKYTSGDLFDPA